MRPLDPIKQQSIIKAVFTITGKVGLAGINMNGISKEAGVGVGSLYTYFKGKDEVIQAAYAILEHDMTDMFYMGMRPGTPVKQCMKQIFINSLNYRLRHYDETVFLDQYRQSSYVQLNFERQLKTFEQQNKPLYDLLKQGQTEGIISNIDHFTMITFISHSIRACANGIAQKLIPMKKKAVEDCFLMLWKGISV